MVVTKIQWTQIQCHEALHPFSIRKENDKGRRNPVTTQLVVLVVLAYFPTGSWGLAEGSQVCPVPPCEMQTCQGLLLACYLLRLWPLFVWLWLGPESSSWVCLDPHGPSPSRGPLPLVLKRGWAEISLGFSWCGTWRNESKREQTASCFQLFFSAKMWVFPPPSEEDASFQGVFNLQTVSSVFFPLL